MTMMNIREEKAKWKKKCWLRRPGSISSFAISLCILSVHCFWAAEINRGELILLQPSAWLTCFTGWFALNIYLRLPGRVRQSMNHLTFCSYTVFAGQKKYPEVWQCLVPSLSPYFATAQPYHAEGCFNLSCRSIDFFHVFSKCTFAFCNPFIFRNFNLSCRVIKSVFPPSSTPNLVLW